MWSESDVLISAWVKLGDSADIDYHVFEDGQIEFSIGGCDGLELVTTEAGLRNLLVHGEEALRAARGAVTAPVEECERRIE